MKRILLLGNPNSGKTTLFNLLTKSRRTTGNRIGVTVDAASGICRLAGEPFELIDLPGVYALTPFTSEEKVVAKALARSDYDALLCVVDSTNAARALCFALSVLNLKKPTVLALNFSDELEKEGHEWDTAALEKLFGVRAFAVSALKNKNLTQLSSAAVKAKASPGGFPEGEEAFTYIDRLLPTLLPPPKKKKKDFTKRADAIALNKKYAYFLMLLTTLLLFAAAFTGAVPRLSMLLQELLTVKLHDAAASLLQSAGASSMLTAFFCDGILKGIGTVLSFLPQIAVLSFLLAILEDTGYLSREAYLCDKPMRCVGLQGKCFVSAFLGFGCSVPAILSTRVLENKHDRVRTMLLIPFLACSAKLPLFVMMSGLFFGGGALPVAVLYLFGAAVGFTYLRVLHKAARQKDEDLFTLELPPYRLPSFRSVGYSVLTRVGEFCFKAGTVLVMSSIAVFLLSTLGKDFSPVQSPADSLLALFGKAVLPLFRPLGITDWRQTVALLSGIFAREAIVSTLGILYGAGPLALKQAFSVPSALSFCVFSLLFLPCVAAQTALYKEMHDHKLFAKTLMIQALIAYALTFCVYRAGVLFFGL